MKRTFLAAAVGLLLVAAGCNGGPEEQQDPLLEQQPAPEERPAAVAPAPKPPAPEPPAPEEQPAARPPQEGAAGQEWEGLLTRLRQQQQVAEQQRFAESDEHYRLAERWYQNSDFDKAEAECQKALQLNPNHLPAQALLLQVQFNQGKARATPASQEIDRAIKEMIVRQEQTLLEIDDGLARGKRAYNAADYDDAERYFRQVLEFAKWLPTGVDLETRRREALDLLERTKAARRQKEIDEDVIRKQMIEAERVRDEQRSKYEQKRELKILFDQAQIEFEKERYDRCIEICDRILYINPNLHTVDEMRMVAQRLLHRAAQRDNLRSYIEEWKRTFEKVEMYSVVQADVLQFPAREDWEEIRKRKPRGLHQFDAEDMSPEDKEIVEKLKSTRITIDMQNASLTAVVDYLREISGLNIVIDNKSIPNPQDEMISIKVSEIYLESVLKLMLQGKQKAHVVEGGVVMITTLDALKKNVRLELYDVQDLTFAVADFPGIDIALSEDSLGVAVAPEETQKEPFTGEDLSKLIQDTIEKDNWDEADGKSILYNNGLLIVRNTPEVHRKISKFLGDLRASTGIMVNVETRFLTVEDDFLQQFGMDLRDLDVDRFGPTARLDDINPAFVVRPTFVSPVAGLDATSPGVTWRGGQSIQRDFGARVQNIVQNDSLVNRFFTRVMSPTGGASLQYTLLDDVSLEAILRLVSRSTRSHILSAPKLTVFNTQRGNLRISNQFAYIRDWNIQLAAAVVALDPVVDIVQDGIMLDVRPIVSADRRFVTLELRPTMATLVPPPPEVFQLWVNLSLPGAPITDQTPVVFEMPVISVARVRSTVVVPDRGTLMLGGVSTYFEIDTDSSIPIWHSIPILGNIGSNKYKGRQKKQLLILVHVEIVMPDEEERRRFE